MSTSTIEQTLAVTSHREDWTRFNLDLTPVIKKFKRTDVPNSYVRIPCIPIVFYPFSKYDTNDLPTTLCSLRRNKHLKHFPHLPGTVFFISKQGSLLYLGKANTSIQVYLKRQIYQASAWRETCPRLVECWENSNLGYIGYYVKYLTDDKEFVGYEKEQFQNSLNSPLNGATSSVCTLSGMPSLKMSIQTK